MTKKETLTSRQRIIRAINHQQMDRMPIDLGSHFSTGISAFAYWNLRQHLGLSTDNIWIADTVQFLAYVDEDILERFHCDVMLLHPKWRKTMRWNPRDQYKFTIPAAMAPKKNEKNNWIVEAGEEKMRMPAGGYFFDGNWIYEQFLGNPEDYIPQFAKEAERIYKETPYATNYTGLFGGYLGALEKQIQMTAEPEKTIEENQAMLENDLKTLSKVIDSMGEYIQLISLNDDLGVQSGPACRPSVLEHCWAPFIKKFCNFVHQNSDVKIFLHSCGSIKPLIPMLIDCGIDVLNPVQISADNMDPQELKNSFGDKITFWGGGCDTQRVLGHKGPAEVAEHVRKLVNIFKPDSGFVFNQVHNIMGNVPPENIIAMYDTAYENS